MKEREATQMEKNFILGALKEGFRIDNRSPNDIRPVKLEIGPELGQAQVQYGDTRVFANVSCEIVRPSPGSSTEGTINFNTEFSPMAFPSLDGDKTSEMEINLSRMLEKALRKSRAIDTEGLCIVANEKVFKF